MLKFKPLSKSTANAFLKKHHGHLPRIKTYTFAIGMIDEFFNVKGIAILKNPSSSSLNDGFTGEVARVATDGTANVSSRLYAQIWKIAQLMGYKRLISYIPEEQSGKSLKAANYSLDQVNISKRRDTVGRPRNNPEKYKIQRWIIGTPLDKTEKTKPLPNEMMRKGAKFTHNKRTDETKMKIKSAIKAMKKNGEKITKSAVAEKVGMSRGHISSRYSDLF